MEEKVSAAHRLRMAELAFGGIEGVYVPLAESLRGFEAILGGDCDDLPEQAFLMMGTIEDVYAAAKEQT